MGKNQSEIEQLVSVVTAQREDNKQLLEGLNDLKEGYNSLKEQVASIKAEKAEIKRGKSALKEARKAPLEVIGASPKLEVEIRKAYETPVKSKQANKNKIRAGYVKIESIKVTEEKPSAKGGILAEIVKTMVDGTVKNPHPFFVYPKKE